MQDSRELYDSYKTTTQKAADLQYASAVLGWDQEVYMPEKGFPFRGRQLATLATLAHEMVTDKAYGDVLETLATNTGLTDDEQQNVEQVHASAANKLRQRADIFGAAAHQLPGLHLVVVGERKPLDLVVKLVAKIVPRAIGQPLGEVAFSKVEERTR